MFVEHNLIKNIKIFTLAFTLTVVLIQLSRFISPLAIIHSSYIFLAWMPLCVMLSILFIFGWRGVVPVLCGMFCTNLWNFHLSFLQTAVMLGSQTFVVLCACAILRWQLGTRWRYGLTSRYVWQRLFWLGLVTPIGIKCSMYLVGSFFDFPLKISTFFGDADAIFTVVDLLSLFHRCADLQHAFLLSHSHDCKSPLCADIVAQGYRSVVGQRETRIYLKLAGSVKRAATSVVHTL